MFVAKMAETERLQGAVLEQSRFRCRDREPREKTDYRSRLSFRFHHAQPEIVHRCARAEATRTRGGSPTSVQAKISS